MTTHTKLPWRIHENVSGALHIENEKKEHVTRVNSVTDESYDKANAALIVHRVNGWDELVKALEFYASEDSYKWVDKNHGDITESRMAVAFDKGEKARNTLTRAKGV